MIIVADLVAIGKGGANFVVNLKSSYPEVYGGRRVPHQDMCRVTRCATVDGQVLRELAQEQGVLPDRFRQEAIDLYARITRSIVLSGRRRARNVRNAHDQDRSNEAQQQEAQNRADNHSNEDQDCNRCYIGEPHSPAILTSHRRICDVAL